MSIALKIRKVLTLYYSMIYKRDDNIWIFGAWFGDKFADNPKYLYLYCLQHGINAVWFTHNHKLYEEMRKKSLPVCMIGSKEANEVAAHAKYNVFCTHPDDTDSVHTGGAVNINLWHGIPIKKICYDDANEPFRYTIYFKIRQLICYIPTRKTYYFSTSDKLSKIFESCFKTNKKHVIQIGQARNDCLFDGSFRKQLFNKINHDKTIVYMPTHRNEGRTKIDVTQIFDLERLNIFCQNNSALFVIKKHFYHKNEKTDLSDYLNIIDITNENIDTQELLYNADVLVTDYSSCYIDYLLLDRPIVFYNYDFEEYLMNDRELYFDYDSVTPGEKVGTFNELIDMLAEVMEGKRRYINKQREIKNMFYSKENQGLVCPQLLKKIMRLK